MKKTDTHSSSIWARWSWWLSEIWSASFSGEAPDDDDPGSSVEKLKADVTARALAVASLGHPDGQQMASRFATLFTPVDGSLLVSGIPA